MFSTAIDQSARSHAWMPLSWTQTVQAQRPKPRVRVESRSGCLASWTFLGRAKT